MEKQNSHLEAQLRFQALNRSICGSVHPKITVWLMDNSLEKLDPEITGMLFGAYVFPKVMMFDMKQPPSCVPPLAEFNRGFEQLGLLKRTCRILKSYPSNDDDMNVLRIVLKERLRDTQRNLSLYAATMFPLTPIDYPAIWSKL